MSSWLNWRTPIVGCFVVLIPTLVVPLMSSSAQAQSSNVKIVQSAEYKPGEILVKLKGAPKNVKAQAFVGRMVSERGLKLKGSWSGLNLHNFQIPAGQTVEQTIADLQQDSSVEYVEPNFIVHRQSAGNPEDVQSMEAAQASSSSVSTSSTAGTGQTAAPIGIGAAWSQMTPGLTPPVVGVIDTGLDLAHPVFVNSGAIWTNPHEIAANGIDDDKNGYIDDVHGWNFVAGTNSPQDDDGHGTHVSGIILGTTMNILASPIGAAPIRIMPVKFLDSTGAGSTSDAVNAIYYAVNNGAKVLNNSWGGSGYSSSLLAAINYAYTSNVAFVAASGNASSNNDSTPTYPANYVVPSMMSIAATDDSDAWASFSNFGPTTVNISSPGVSIYSTYPGNNWAKLSGTSMATPFVSGVAALMIREKPTMNGYQVKNVLFSGTQQISSLSGRTAQQSRVNVYNALVAAQQSVVASSEPDSSTRAPASTAAASGGGCGLVAKVVGDNIGDGEGGGGPFAGGGKSVGFFLLMAVLIAPIAVSLVLRQKSGRDQRRYTRYHIDSSVKVKFGDRELVGQVSTISLGGVQLNTEEWLEKGGIVKMSIRSPDGRDELEVEGKIVWTEEQKRYGVAFADADDSVITSINRWTKSLLRA